VILAAAQQLSTGQQVALLLVITGALWWVYVLARGAALVLLVVAYLTWRLLRAALILTARVFLRIDEAHARGVQRVRRYEAQHAATVEP
jgi:hypothetical protein